MKKMRFRYQIGAFLLFLFFGGLFLLLFGRFFQLQSTGEANGYDLQAYAASQYARESVLEAERGKILDRSGNVIAEDTVSFKVVAVLDEKLSKNTKNLQHVEDKAETARLLAPILDIPEEEIYERLMRDKQQVEFGAKGRNLSYETKKAIDELDLPGINFETEKKRHYPNGSFASHVIGFVAQDLDKDNNPLETVSGKMGVELTYDEVLKGKNGILHYQRDNFGYLLANGEEMIEPAQNGYEIHMTLDKTIQSFLDDALTRVDEEYNPEAMMAVVSNPKTGEILAMSQRPTFNPDNRSGLSDTTWLNATVEDVLEPGSTVKTFTIAAAIDTNNWHPNETFQSGSYTLFGTKIKDHNKEGWGSISYLDGFLRSSNTMIANQLKIMGTDTLIEYMNKFGFGQKTGINLPGEATGKLLVDRPIEKVTLGYGQGSTFTAIQLVQAMGAIANDGKMMQPYIIDKIVNPNTGEIVEQFEPTVKGKPVSAETAKQVRELLALTVTDEKGTGKNYNIDSYQVAGKTGTAQIPKANGDYFEGNHHYFYSFLGMVPVEDPQLVVYVAVKHPKLNATQQGSEPVSKVFNSVVENSLKYLNVNPEDTVEAEKHEIQDVIGQTAEAVQVELMNAGITPIIIGNGGTITEQYPKAGIELTKNSVVFLKTEGNVTLPDLTGMSMRNLLVYKAMSGLNMQVTGEGYVTSQSVVPQTVVGADEVILIELKTPQQQYGKQETTEAQK